MLVLIALMILVPACLLIIVFVTPLFKDLMIEVATGWGAEVGLEGFALLIANMMPLIVPVMCLAGIVATLIGLVRTKGSI